MTYAEALKKLNSKTKKSNYLLIKFGYDCKILLPYKDGLVFLDSLSNAEKFVEKYNEPCRIVPMETNTIDCCILSGEEYEAHKIAALLNVTVDEVKQYALEESA